MENLAVHFIATIARHLITREVRVVRTGDKVVRHGLAHVLADGAVLCVKQLKLFTLKEVVKGSPTEVALR